MSISERAAFLRGLLEGLNIDDSTPERKLLLALTETIEEIACELSELSEVTEALEDELADLSDCLDELGGDGGCCSHGHSHESDPILDLQCPACKNSIGISREMLSDGRFPCPHCGENLEIDDISGEDGDDFQPEGDLTESE